MSGDALRESDIFSRLAASRAGRFVPWAVETVLVALSGFVAFLIWRELWTDAFVFVAAFGGILCLLTIVFLAALRHWWPIRAGKHPRESRDRLLWELHSFLCLTNLFLFYQNALLPPLVRKFFARALGGRAGPGIMSIGGVLTDPYLISIGKEVTVGYGALIMPATEDGEKLTVGPIRIDSGAVVGARSMIMPGVTIGEGSMVKAMSLVAEDTVIPPNEVWGGVPAKKLGALPVVSAGPRFGSWRDLVLTPLVVECLVFGAGLVTWIFWRKGWIREPFMVILTFYVSLEVWTALGMGILRALFPIEEGNYSIARDSGKVYGWLLHSFLCSFNLTLQFTNRLLPTVLRRQFHRFLGAKHDHGLFNMPGMASEPYLVEFGRGSMLQHEVLVLSHAITVDSVLLKRVTVGEGAVIHPRSVLMPGVEVESGAEVEAMSLVTMNKHIPAGERWGGIPARPLGKSTAPAPGGKHMQWQDLVLTALVEIAIFGGAGSLAWRGGAAWDLSLFSIAALFYSATVALSLLFLAGLRELWPFREGSLTERERPWAFYRWKLHGFICNTNLFLHYQCEILPGPARRAFFRLLGARLGKKSKVLGLLVDPALVTIGDDAVIGLESVILTLKYFGSLIDLKGVRIGRGAMIGPRAMILPGVTVGEGARVEPFSLVPAGAVIPPHEVWAGIPAAKVGDIQAASRP